MSVLKHGSVGTDLSQAEWEAGAGATGRHILSAGNPGDLLQYDGVNIVGATLATVKTTVALTAVDINPLSTQGVILVDATGGNRTMTLPAVAGLSGRMYTIKKIDNSNNEVIVDGNGAETIDGDVTAVLTIPFSSVTVVADETGSGSDWRII